MSVRENFGRWGETAGSSVRLVERILLEESEGEEESHRDEMWGRAL